MCISNFILNNPSSSCSNCNYYDECEDKEDGIFVCGRHQNAQKKYKTHMLDIHE